MYRETYKEIETRFIVGRDDVNKRAYWAKTCSFAQVSISDRLMLYHKRSRLFGILTHIGDEKIGIRDSLSGDLINGEYTEFFLVDEETDLPIFNEPIFDRLGKRVVIGSWVAFAQAHHGGLRIGRVARVTPIGSIMIEAVKEPTRKAASGMHCIVLDENHPEVIAGKEFFEI